MKYEPMIDVVTGQPAKLRGRFNRHPVHPERFCDCGHYHQGARYGSGIARFCHSCPCDHFELADA